jgi:S-adenosyl methyltransferase
MRSLRDITCAAGPRQYLPVPGSDCGAEHPQFRDGRPNDYWDYHLPPSSGSTRARNAGRSAESRSAARLRPRPGRRPTLSGWDRPSHQRREERHSQPGSRSWIHDRAAPGLGADDPFSGVTSSSRGLVSTSPHYAPIWQRSGVARLPPESCFRPSRFLAGTQSLGVAPLVKATKPQSSRVPGGRSRYHPVPRHRVGLPTQGAVHQVVREVNPHAHVVYVDYDRPGETALAAGTAAFR